MWIKIQFSKRKKNVKCGILYRQHNSPEKFQQYFDLAVEKYSTFYMLFQKRVQGFHQGFQTRES